MVEEEVHKELYSSEALKTVTISSNGEQHPQLSPMERESTYSKLVGKFLFEK